MLNNNLNKTRRNKKELPHLSLNLHTMPRSSEQHFYNWMIWGGIILLGLIVGAYFLFN